MLNTWKFIIIKYFFHYNIPTVCSHICVNFVCSMLEVATISSVRSWCWWHGFVIIWCNMSSSVLLHNSTKLILISISLEDFHENISFNKPHKGKSDGFNQGWEVAKFAAIVMVQISVWHDARPKNNIKEVQHDICSLQCGTILHKPLRWETQAFRHTLLQEVVLEHMQILLRIYCFIKNNWVD